MRERPEIFCWVVWGRTPRSLMSFAGQILVSHADARGGQHTRHPDDRHLVAALADA